MNTKQDKRTELDKEIDDLLIRIRHTDPQDEEYAKLISLVERLTALKETPREKVSWNNVLTVAGSILGIVLIIGHEQIGHVISTKALSFVLRGRV